MHSRSPDAEERLQNDWFAAAGLQPPRHLAIHPDDDMYQGRVLQVSPERRRQVYMRCGHESLCVLENALSAAGCSLDRAGAVLDFACGYGRLLRFLVDRCGAERVHGSDILAPAVQFVRDTFGIHAFDSARRPEDLVLPRRYDVIHVGSLFSHLPRATFAPFLAVLARGLTDDGVLVFTTHNPSVHRGALDPSGFTFVPLSESEVLATADYGSTFVEPALVQAIAKAQGLTAVATLEREVWRIQDVHVASRRDLPGLRHWRPTPIARGSIVRAELRADGHAWVGGFVRLPRVLGAPREVWLGVDGARLVRAEWRPHPQALPDGEGGRWFDQFDWYTEGPAAELLAGEHTVAAIAVLADGTRSCFDARLLERVC
ncbi:MAG: class I SAM-dependent methyltransferase [Planctomycetes bacterium]|nr:class I SAM-dependent methyltransferase [Planctomycetota bacterium]